MSSSIRAEFVMNRSINFFLFAAALLSLPFLYVEMTQGFRINKLYLAPFLQAELEANQKTEPVLPLLCQPFRYLGKGMQFFVFESQDKQVVIKLFKRPKKNHSPERIQKTFSACQLAFTLAPKETGLLYIHLCHSSDQLPALTLKNRLGISYSIPLDSYSFVIQKKAEPFYSALLQAFRNGSAASLIDSYLALIASRSSKGICNTDFLLKNNFGFLGDQAIEMDFGNYIYAPENKEKELHLFTGRMRRFIKKHAPEYLTQYDDKVAAL